MSNYSTQGFGEMIADRTRIDAYAKALAARVTPQTVVLDLGAGPGIMSLIACQCGAKRVYAVEVADIIELARAAAAANGFADRLFCVHGLSTEVSLPELATLMVFDLRGALPLFERHIPSVVDARRRLLQEGAHLVPKEDTLWAAVIEAPDQFAKLTVPWQQAPFGLDLSAGLRLARNSIHPATARPQQLLSEPTAWLRLDYRSVERASHAGQATLRVVRDGIGHGLLMWFETELAEGVGFSAGPSDSPAIYGQAFFPWEHPLRLNRGDTVEIKVRADYLGRGYVWTWRTRVVMASVRGGSRTFDQSTFLGTPLTPERLARHAAEYLPELSREGEMVQFVLQHFERRLPLADVAQALSRTFGFATTGEALALVREVSDRYGRWQA